MTVTVKQGESFKKDYTLSPSQDLTDFVCRVQIRSTDKQTVYLDRVVTETANNDRTILVEITNGETNNLLAGSYSLGIDITNSDISFNDEFCETLVIEAQCVYPTTAAAEALVAFAVSQPTPETQLAAQNAVDQLPIDIPPSTVKSDFQVRIDALDAEVANVEAARVAVTTYETYPNWTASVRQDAVDLVSPLESDIERTALNSRIAEMNDELAASEAMVLAENLRTSSYISLAQTAINNVDPVDNQPVLQARLDVVETYARLVAYGSDFSNVTNSYYLSRSGLRFRAAGTGGAVQHETVIAQGSGWASVSVNVLMRPIFNTFIGIGNIDQIAPNTIADQAAGDDTALLMATGVWYNGGQVSSLPTEVVIAVDYRGTNPIVYVMDGDLGTLLATQTLNYTGDVSFALNSSGNWNTDNEREYYYEINSGSDIVNRPFPVDGQAILDAELVDTTGYAIGWGGNSSLTSVSKSAFQIDADDVTFVIGQESTITASLIDTNGIDRSSTIRWRNQFDNWLLNDNVITGRELTFTPQTYGSYTIVAEYEDMSGAIRRKGVTPSMVNGHTMAGALAFDITNSFPTVTIGDENIAGTGDTGVIALNDLANNSVIFNDQTPFKKAAVGNVAIFGEYRYFELKITNNTTPNNFFGSGLMSVLNENVGWSGGANGDEPQEGAGGFSILNGTIGATLGQPWINGSNLTYRGDGMANGDSSNSDFSTAQGVIGFAVDYRDTTSPPIVHVIHSSGGIPTFAYSFRVWNCRTPLRPIIYVNEVTQSAIADACINGQQSNMIYDPIAVLTAASVDVTGLLDYWGDADNI